jgi:hypothetical protein
VRIAPDLVSIEASRHVEAMDDLGRTRCSIDSSASCGYSKSISVTGDIRIRSELMIRNSAIDIGDKTWELKEQDEDT